MSPLLSNPWTPFKTICSAANGANFHEFSAGIREIRGRENTPAHFKWSLVINKQRAEHYSWGQACDGWHLVQGEALSVIQERMPPHTSEVRHAHHRARQFFFVLGGIAVFELNGQRTLLHPQEGIEVPPGAPHQIQNESDDDLEFLVISQPPSHGDRVRVDESPPPMDA